MHRESCGPGLPSPDCRLCGLRAERRPEQRPGDPLLTVRALPSLFPTMPRHNFHKVAPLVKSLCAKHGIQYQEKPLLRALQDIIR